MKHPYDALKSDYTSMLATAVIRPECEHGLAGVATRLLRDKPVYQRIFEATGVPVAALMALAEREMSGDLHCYLGNGQRLNMRTTIVPKGRGPFPDTTAGFIAGALDALHLDGLDQIAATAEAWSMTRTLYEDELWNGFGYRAHGIPSPYLVGGTTAQKPGKYVRDGVFDASVMDPQLGTLAIMLELFKQDPSMVFGGVVAPSVTDAPPLVPAPLPTGVGGGFLQGLSDVDTVKALQQRLNEKHALPAPIGVDGSYGRETTAAVRAFQAAHGLHVDGIVGPLTIRALGFAPA